MNRLLLLILTVLALHLAHARDVTGRSYVPATTSDNMDASVVPLHTESVDITIPIRSMMRDCEPVTDDEIDRAAKVGFGLEEATAQEQALPFAATSLVMLQDLPQVAKPRLLPERMSFMERGLWGEEGVFRSWGITGALTPETRKHELDVRRTMLSVHQIGGFATLASMIATVYFGQKFLDTGDRKALDMHETFIPITVGLYTTTGLLSILSPPPLIRRDEVSTTSIHKLLAWVHVAGMIITPILGAAISRRSASFEEKARVHQVAGYITTGVFAASMIAITF